MRSCLVEVRYIRIEDAACAASREGSAGGRGMLAAHSSRSVNVKRIVSGVMVQKGGPLLASWMRSANMPHVLLNGSLADTHAEFHSFPANPLSPPEPILLRHLSDQCDSFRPTSQAYWQVNWHCFIPKKMDLLMTITALFLKLIGCLYPRGVCIVRSRCVPLLFAKILVFG